MEGILTTQNVTFALGILGVIFGIWNKVRIPQEDLEKKQAISEKEVDKKASLLAQQLQWTIEGNEKRFTEMQANIKEAFSLAQNHTHTVETKVDALTETVTSMGNMIVRLSTIIDERIPKKN